MYTTFSVDPIGHRLTLEVFVRSVIFGVLLKSWASLLCNISLLVARIPPVDADTKFNGRRKFKREETSRSEAFFLMVLASYTLLLVRGVSFQYPMHPCRWIVNDFKLMHLPLAFVYLFILNVDPQARSGFSSFFCSFPSRQNGSWNLERQGGVCRDGRGRSRDTVLLEAVQQTRYLKDEGGDGSLARFVCSGESQLDFCTIVLSYYTFQNKIRAPSTNTRRASEWLFSDAASQAGGWEGLRVL